MIFPAILKPMLALILALNNILGIGLTGQLIDSLIKGDSCAVVLFFTATDCPIANRYLPELQKLANDEQSKGVVVWFVYPNPGDTAQVVRAQRSRYGVSGNAVLDTRHTLTRMAHASVTPEAAVFVPDGKGGLREVYHGRIDDRYAGLGRERPQAMHHDLKDALDAVLAVRPVAAPGGPAVGCSIMPLDQ